MLRDIAAGSVAYIFWSQKLKDDVARNCKFCGELFLPGSQPGIDSLPPLADYWRRTLCSVECASERRALGAIEARARNLKKPGSKRVARKVIFERDKYICYLCGGQTVPGYTGRDLRLRAEQDHVVPVSGEGVDHPDNVRCCCGRCNLGKGSMTLQEQIKMYSDDAIDFDDTNKYPVPATLDELISAWRKYVLPSVIQNSMFQEPIR